jgi:tetratricopeptide (TPR) repeat protein
MRYFVIGMLATMVCILVAGCAGNEQVRAGDAMMARGDYDGAVRAYREAAELSRPKGVTASVDDLGELLRTTGKATGNRAFDRNLARIVEAKDRAAWWHVTVARREMSSHDPWKAMEHAKKALSYVADMSEAKALDQEALSEARKAEGMRDDVLLLTKENRWAEAAAEMDKVLAIWPNLPGGRQARDEIRGGAYRYYVAEANEKMAADDWRGAVADSREAMKYAGADPREARAIEAQAARRDEAMRLAAEGKAAMAERDYERAITMFERAAKMYGGMAETNRLLGQAKEAYSDQQLDEGRRLVEAGRYVEAIQSLRHGRMLLDDAGGIDALIGKAGEGLYAEDVKAANEYLGAHQYGRAMLYAAMGLGFRQDDSVARRIVGQSSGALRDDIRFTIGVARFAAASRDRGLAADVRSRSVELMRKAGAANVVVADMGASPDDTVAPGVTALLTGELFDVKVNSRQTSRQATSEYQAGMKLVPNDRYLEVQRDYDRAMKTHDEAMEELSRREHRLDEARRGQDASKINECQRQRDKARKDWESADRERNRRHDVLRNTPRDILVPDVRTYTYLIYTETRWATVGCAVRLLDAATREIIFSEEVKGEAEASDDYVEGDTHRNVKADPLDLPGDGVLVDEAMKKLKARLDGVIGRASRLHGTRFLKQMHQAQAAGDDGGAVENAVKYLLSYPDGGEDTAEAMHVVEEYTGGQGSLVNLWLLLRI